MGMSYELPKHSQCESFDFYNRNLVDVEVLSTITNNKMICHIMIHQELKRLSEHHIKSGSEIKIRILGTIILLLYISLCLQSQYLRLVSVKRIFSRD